jgi:hypothetical protein
MKHMLHTTYFDATYETRTSAWLKIAADKIAADKRILVL